MSRKLTVFLSHNDADKPAVEALALKLRKEADIKPWFDKWDLIPGTAWQDELERVITNCDVCVVFFGPNGLGGWHHEEMRALNNRRVTDRHSDFRVIPVLLSGAERVPRTSLPAFLVTTSWVEFRHVLEDAEAWRRLLCGIRGQKPGPPSDDGAALAECPYRGLGFFDVAHANFFFGRESVTEWLVDDIRKPLRRNSELPRFLAILGASGSGKSSLARAGLYAALRNGAIEGSRDWLFVPPLRPGPNPLESLELAVLQAAAGSPRLEIIRHELRELSGNPDRLHRTARLLVSDILPQRRLFLLVDQFEEVFTACENEELRGSFIAALLHAACEHGGPVIIALTMRADFYPNVAAYEELARMVSQHQLLVGPMSKAELRRAIEEPAFHTGSEFEPGLADKLLEDVHRQPGALPLMEHALLELWHRREQGRRLTHGAYETIGKLEGALERRGNEVFGLFTDEDKELCRRFFLRLVHPGEGAEDTRRRVQLRELLELGDGTRIQKLIETLAAPDVRLVVIEGTDARLTGGFVEVAHETLIRSWSRLRKWLDADRAGLRTHRRLTESAREWDERGRKPDFLYSGGRLAIAEEWAALNKNEPNELEKMFLQASAQSEKDALRAKMARTAQLEALRKIETRLLEQEFDRDALLHQVVTSLVELTGAFYGMLYLNEGGRLRKTAHVGLFGKWALEYLEPDFADHKPLVTVRAFKSNSVQTHHGINKEDYFKAFRIALGNNCTDDEMNTIRGFLSVPLVADDMVIGALTVFFINLNGVSGNAIVFDKDYWPWPNVSNETITLVQDFAIHAGLIIKNATLIKGLIERRINP